MILLAAACRSAESPRATPPAHVEAEPTSQARGLAESEDAVLPAQLEETEASRTAERDETLALLRAALDDDRAGARELLTETVASLIDPRPGAESAHEGFLLELDRIAKALGSLEESRMIRESIVRMRERTLPPDHGDLLKAKGNLAVTLKQLGDLAGASAIEQEVLAGWVRTLPPDHPNLVRAKGNVAMTKHALGDLEGACALEEEVLASFERTLPADHDDLVRAKLNLAATKCALGDLTEARELAEAVLTARLRLLPPSHPDLARAKLALANVRLRLGDFGATRALQEEALAALEQTLPPGHAETLIARASLAATRKELGDLAGASVLFEQVVADWARQLPPDHPHLLGVKQNLAATRKAMGDFAGAHALFEEVLAVWTRVYPADHPDVLATQLNLAGTRRELGDLAGASALVESVVAALERSPGRTHLLALARLSLGVSAYAVGDLARARSLFEALLATWTPLLPSGHPWLLTVQQDLVATYDSLGDAESARTLGATLLAGMRARARALRLEAPRLARESARAEIRRLQALLSSSVAGESSLQAEIFATLEDLRLTSVGSAEAARVARARPDAEELLREVRRLRAELNDHVAAGFGEGDSAEEWRAHLLRLASERDSSERALRVKLADAGAFIEGVDPTKPGGGLEHEAAVVSYLRCPQRFEGLASGTLQGEDDVMLAFLVTPNGGIRRFDLGSAAELEDLVSEWRGALGRPLEGRGLGLAQAASGGSLDAAGQRIRERVLDPVLAAAGTRTLHVLADDFLFLVPFDALPLGTGLVGDAFALRSEVTLARFLRPSREEAAPDGELTIAGFADFDAEVGAEVAPFDADIAPLNISGDRSGPDASVFRSLPGTEAETRSIADLYRREFKREGRVLTRGAATKKALSELAPTTRFLHLATHGWFASERHRSQLDPSPSDRDCGSWGEAAETQLGFAPETLCGLALSGANRGKDDLGRVNGLLTAEELAGFDLDRCELAVLSACETNVGIRRAGQGIQSLQTALHAAGARTSITSLWRVDDDATRRLFELFYAKLWQEGLEKAEALWQAKMTLRAEGHPPLDWAGWVLYGAPD